MATLNTGEGGALITPELLTPDQLLRLEEDSSAEDSWSAIYIPWHRDAAFWTRYSAENRKLQDESAILKGWPAHRKAMAAITAGLLLLWAFGRWRRR